MSRWYIIHAYSGFENKVKEAILADATRLGLEQLVEAVEVPTEKVTEVRRGKKITSDTKFFPGYVLAKLSMNDDVYHLVKNTPKVTGFLGSSGKPQPISEAEAARILEHQGGGRRRRAEAEDQGRLRDRRSGQGARRPVRQLQRPRRGARFRSQPRQGLGLDLRPRDPGRAGVRAGRTGQVRFTVTRLIRDPRDALPRMSDPLRNECGSAFRLDR